MSNRPKSNRTAVGGSEYYVTVTLRIPHRLLGRITKKTIQSKDVKIVAADWGKVREIYSPNVASDLSPSANGDQKTNPDVAADGD